MKQKRLKIESNRSLNETVYEMKLSGIRGAAIRPGQFVNLKLDGLFLRRPISVCDAEGDLLTLVYRTVGKGTDQMSRMKPGEVIDTLLELGNGYDLSAAGEQPLLIGGGVGVPPLYALAKNLIESGKEVTAILGFNTASDVFYENEFRTLGAKVTVTTADGSYGTKGFVTDAMPETSSFFYACGPMPMLKAVYHKTNGSGQFSLEERMGCGFGACMGCSILTRNGTKRVCKEGPVFYKEDLAWDD